MNSNNNPSSLNNTAFVSKKLITLYRTVHCAEHVETPPDVLRYIFETNANDVRKYNNIAC